MQMVSVLALNKLELKEMIDAEMVENPVLEEIDETVPMLDQVAGREELLGRGAEEPPAPPKDSFNEIDFGSYFQDYLDPGYRTQPEYEESEKPSFENFLSQPTTLSDHLAWQLGALTLEPRLFEAAEFVIGNLDDSGYVAASDEELAVALSYRPGDRAAENGSHGNGKAGRGQPENWKFEDGTLENGKLEIGGSADLSSDLASGLSSDLSSGLASQNGHNPELAAALDLVRRGIDLVQHLDPTGVGARDLRECLMLQIRAQQQEFNQLYARQYADGGEDYDPHRGLRDAAEAQWEQRRRGMEVAALIVDKHLQMLLKRDMKDLARAAQVTPEEAQGGVEFIRTLDPHPGRLYNREQTRLIEPDVVFIKRGGEWVVSMNEEDMPSLRLSSRYRRMLVAEGTDKEVKDYVKERFRSAMQLMRNIAQRKSTILKTCEVIVRRQQEFFEVGVEGLRPMMIKEVAEEIGVHPSTVSRAVANKYAHTPQGVLELRFFFSAGSNGPEGADTPLLVLKRKVKKLIEDEDAGHPLTDDQLAALLQAQGIQLTRRTVAKYREDMNIPSTHQRRRRDK
jgi:RNA polymerase sigma-54 factor